MKRIESYRFIPYYQMSEAFKKEVDDIVVAKVNFIMYSIDDSCLGLIKQDIREYVR